MQSATTSNHENSYPVTSYVATYTRYLASQPIFFFFFFDQGIFLVFSSSKARQIAKSLTHAKLFDGLNINFARLAGMKYYWLLTLMYLPIASKQAFVANVQKLRTRARRAGSCLKYFGRIFLRQLCSFCTKIFVRS